ncbi:MAG TPA: sulfite exporter TauE/SafE family protein [Candidatus Saccharimonadales bacterium]|nr:sulfite exporter TauE/SafE family protein [Candidatus Saccharimonadales bacterium]
MPPLVDVLLIAIGLLAGMLSGLVGVGGGIVIVPALVMLLGFSQKNAQGTTLAMLMVPVGILAALTYYRAGHVNIKAALFIGLGFLFGALIGAQFAIRLPDHTMTRVFGGLLLAVGLKFLLLGK